MAEFEKVEKRLKPAQWIDRIAESFPGVWQFYADEVHPIRHMWSDWCFAPVQCAFHFLDDQEPELRTAGNLRPLSKRDPQHDYAWYIAGIAAWRTTMGIYKFPAVLTEELSATPLMGDIPIEQLKRLPEWCVYVEFSDEYPRAKEQADGFFAFLDEIPADCNDGYPVDLCLLMNTGEGLACGVIPLVGTVEQSLAAGHVALSGEPATREVIEDFSFMIAHLLYLCAPDAELVPTRFRNHCRPKLRKGRRGSYMPTARGVEVWQTGFSLARSLQDARSSDWQGGTVRPHIRRAHWHSYWCGTGDDKAIQVRWLPPIRVKISDELVPTVHNLKT